MKRILVIRHGALGDIVFAQGAFKAIASFHKGDDVTLLTNTAYSDFMAKSPYFTSIWVDDRAPIYKKAFFSLLWRIHKGRFHRVYDLQRSGRTHLYHRLLKCLSPLATQWSSDVKSAAFPYCDPQRFDYHIYDRHKYQLQCAGISNVSDPNLDWVSISSLLVEKLPHPFMLFVPGSSPTQLHKRWPSEKYVSLAKILYNQGITPVIIGTKADQDMADAIQSSAPYVRSLIGQTQLEDVCALASHAKGAVGHDTGPMHMVAISGAPSVMLFSYSSIPHRYAPRKKTCTVLHKQDLKDISVREVSDALFERMHMLKQAR